MAGFLETFAQNASGALGDWEKQKEQKRLRALQKLKFLVENGDVGTAVDPQAAQEISDYAPEGNSFIKDGALTGTPEQQRVAEFRKWTGENPDVDEDTFMTKGMTAGAIPAGSYASYQSGKAAREQRHQDLLLRLQEQKAAQEDRQQHAMQMRGIIEAGMRQRANGGGADDLGSGIEHKPTRQHWADNRRAYGNNPYEYITQQLYNYQGYDNAGNPLPVDRSAPIWKELLAALDKEEDPSTMSEQDLRSMADNPEVWNSVVNGWNAERMGMKEQYGLKDNELGQVINHFTAIKNKKAAKKQKGK